MKRLSYFFALTMMACLSSPPATAQLIGHWTFDGTTDDASGNMNHGTIQGGVSFSDDVPATLGGGQSASFDGVAGTFVNVTQNTGLPVTTTETFTISMWVRGDGTVDNVDDRIFSEGMTTDTNPLFNLGTQNGGADGRHDFFFRNGASSGHLFSEAEPFDNSWHHVAWVDVGHVGELFIDGVADSTYVYNELVNDGFAPDTTTIGGILRATDCCNFTGNIDDVSIWNVALSGASVADLANGTSPGVLMPTLSDREPPAPPRMGVVRDPAAIPDQGPGNWNVRVIGIDTQPDGTGDGDINNHTEARAILAYAGEFTGDYAESTPKPGLDENLNLNGWAIYEDHQESRNIVNFTNGGDNSFPQGSGHAYPGPDPPNLSGEDFLVNATTEEPILFAPNTTFAINFGSDDGGQIRIIPTDGSDFVFDNERGTNGDDVFDDTIFYNGNRGHGQTCGEFTTGPAGLSAHIDASMHERGGGDNLEISLAEGGCLSPTGTLSDVFQLIDQDVLPTDDGRFLASTNPDNVATDRTGGGPPPSGLACDLNSDGVCDTADLNQLYADAGNIAEWLTQASADDGIEGDNEHRLGDANLDGNVDSTDLGLLLNNFNGEGGPAAQWGGGDLNNSGNVDSTDLGLLLNNFNFTSAASTSAVPEPNSFVLLGIGALALLRRRRR